MLDLPDDVNGAELSDNNELVGSSLKGRVFMSCDKTRTILSRIDTDKRADYEGKTGKNCVPGLGSDIKAASLWSKTSSSSFSTEPWPAGIAFIIGSKLRKS